MSYYWAHKINIGQCEYYSLREEPVIIQATNKSPSMQYFENLHHAMLKNI